MRVAINSSVRLSLEHRPLLVPLLAASCVAGLVIKTIGSAASLSLGEWVATGAGVLVGSLIAYLSALPSRVEFDAVRSAVNWCHTGWPGRARGNCPLRQVTGIELHADESGCKRLVLTTSAGVVPLTRHFTAFERHEQNAATVREWLDRHGRGTPLNHTTESPRSGANPR